MNERGTALIATLTIALILLPLGAFVAMQCRTDLLIQHNLRAEIEVFYAAEAGLEHAISEVGPVASLDTLLFGPDHLAGTGDDGAFPFRGGKPGPFPHAPLQYDVRVTRVDATTVRVMSRATGLKNATKVVSALATSAATPYTPAALYVEGDLPTIDLGASGFLISGMDHDIGASAGSASGAAAPIPALGMSQTGDGAALEPQLSPDTARRLIGAGGTPSIARSAPVDLPLYATAIARRPERFTIAGTIPAVLGTAQDPQISLAVGDCDVSGQVAGSGILLVYGRLHVTGGLSYAGLVVAMGGVQFEPGSVVSISGAFWEAAHVPDTAQFQGDGAIAYSTAALAAADRKFQGLLPHTILIAGWQEQM